MRISDWSSDVCSSDLRVGSHTSRSPLSRKQPCCSLAPTRASVGAHPVGDWITTWRNRSGPATKLASDRAYPDLLAIADVLGHHDLDAGVQRDRKSTRLNSSH